MSIAGAAGIAGAMAMGGTASAAETSCDNPGSKLAFASFGDTSSYFLAPGGSFEGALTWGRSGSAAIVAGNEPFMLNAATDRQSVRLSAGASVTSPRMCITRDMPHLRFVAKANGGSPLEVSVRVYGGDGKLADAETSTVPALTHLSWAPSGNVSLLPDALNGATAGSAEVTFRTQGDWQVDDVFVDPYAR